MDNRFFEYQGEIYPTYLKQGHAADHIIPIAKHFCKGNGLDIGGQTACHFPDAQIINIDPTSIYHANKLPPGEYDYIFSSHTLEHIENYVDALICWREHLHKNGTLFLYLPHPDMVYWRPEYCKKHFHVLTPYGIKGTLEALEFENILCSQRDLYWSFAVVATKKG